LTRSMPPNPLAERLRRTLGDRDIGVTKRLLQKYHEPSL